RPSTSGFVGNPAGSDLANRVRRSFDHLDGDDRRAVAALGTADRYIRGQKPLRTVMILEQPFPRRRIEPRRERIGGPHDFEELRGRQRGISRHLDFRSHDRTWVYFDLQRLDGARRVWWVCGWVLVVQES